MFLVLLSNSIGIIIVIVGEGGNVVVAMMMVINEENIIFIIIHVCIFAVFMQHPEADEIICCNKTVRK